MARGSQFLKLQTMLREELNRSSNVAVGVDDLPGLKDKLQRTQETLYDDYDWPFLREVFPLKSLAAGVRYYDFPVDANNYKLNLERVEEVKTWFGNLPRELERGIDFRNYAVYNSNIGVTSDPALRWDVRWTGTSEQIEVWPIPAGNAQQVQFIGIRELRPLVADADVADLDDQLIVLWAAAELLARQGAASAEMVTKLAQARLNKLKARVKAASDPVRMGMGEGQRDSKVKIVVRAS